MKGARDFADLIPTGQYGRLYCVASSHARGRTFRVFVLPKDEQAKPNAHNAPLNEDAVEVYGVVSGQPGWTEAYGWLHHGPWEVDFQKLVEQHKEAKSYEERLREASRIKKETEHKLRTSALLNSY